MEDDETGESFEVGSAFNGSFEKTIVPENGIFVSGNKFYFSEGSTNIKGLRGWFTVDAKLNEALAYAKISIEFDDDVTGIDGVSTQRTIEGVYDLQGRKMKIENNDLNSLQKGVYIIDGKKVTIK